MRKLMILALVAMLTIAGSAFAQGRFGAVEPNATSANGRFPTSTNNDDTCDIGVTPAATLLLPYFEVDVNAALPGTGETTLWTVTNVSRAPQIAHVTVWTDWSFPVLDFNIFLTGYDTQSIDMFDVLVRGIVAPGGPGTSSTSKTISPVGTGVNGQGVPAANTANPNIIGSSVLAGGVCSGTNLPGGLPPTLVAAVRTALTTGLYNPQSGGCGNVRVGGTHDRAVGYVTIDVANTCSTNLPDNPDYIATELLFDNVLIGDYQQVNGAPAIGNFAQGNPLVHIRAVPEGGPAGSNPGTNLPYTFYDRYTSDANPRFDRRQPLPATFAARWLQGGTSQFETDYKIWREGLTFGTQSCGEADDNSNLPIADVVRFDERENAFALGGGQTICSPCEAPPGQGLPETSRTNIGNASIFPSVTTSDVAGWTYLNLNNGGSTGYSSGGVRGGANTNFAPQGSNTITRPSQNWVIVSMRAQGRYSVDFDAAWLGNGCSAAAADPNTAIGPAGGIFVCPPGITCVAPAGTIGYVGTNVTP